MNILFVCSGNTCRSPMAEALFRKMLSDVKEDPGVDVRSAGITARGGEMVSKQAMTVLAEEGIELGSFRSKPVDKKLIDWADIILTMTREHKEAVLRLDPKAHHKTYALKEFARDDGELNRRLSRIEEINHRYTKKRNQFLNKHEDQISGLYAEKMRLEKRLLEVENEIRSWEEKLRDLTRQEEQELRLLDRELSDLDIRDPFGQDLPTYRKTLKEIKQELEKVLAKITNSKER